jgi:branched-chain amino acid transport system substrate-binding protein
MSPKAHPPRLFRFAAAQFSEISMSQKRGTPGLIFSLLFIAGLLGVGTWWLTQWLTQSAGPPAIIPSVTPTLPNVSLGQLERRLSTGQQILVASDTTPEKQAGSKAFASGDFVIASNKFQASLAMTRNDPESLIYLNNAKAGAQTSLYIAVSVPTGGNFAPVGGSASPIGYGFDVAKEILRGVAQAQNQVNQQGGINGVPLQVVIANDSNDPAIGQQIATALVQDPKIVAVVGHAANDVSIAAAPIYQKGRLVMVSPTSQAKKLSNVGNYAFRTIPSMRFVAGILARYNVKANLKHLAICADSKAESSQSLKAEMAIAIAADGGKVSPIVCDFSAADFEPRRLMGQILEEGADSLLLAPSADRFTQAIDLAQANQGRLPMLGSPSLYALRTLETGQSAVNGMVLAVNWHPEAAPDNHFVGEAKNLWGDQFTWRTALAYDATQAIITGLQQSTTRDGFQKAIASEKFGAPGATGPIQFLPSGDRNGTTFLVKIQPGNKSGQGYDFVLMK